MAAPDKPPKIQDVFNHGADEIVIRVSNYGPDAETPDQWQAIVRHRIASKPWGVGVESTPAAATQAALKAFMRLHQTEEDDLI